MTMTADPPANTPAAQQQSDLDRRNLVGLVDQRYTYARSAKVPRLPTWATCLAFYVGDQWREWNAEQRKLITPTKIPKWRVLPIYNQIPGIIDLAAAQLSQARQLPRARPDDNEDPEDREAAKRGTQALRAWWYRAGMEELEHEANVTRILLGSAWIHLYWDPQALAKVPVPDPMTGQPKARYAPVGDICAEVLTPFDVFPEPTESYRDASWVIVAKRKPLSWFKAMFGDEGAKVRAEAAGTEDAFSSLLPHTDQATEGGGAPEGDGLATLKILYEKPCKDYPQGRTVYLADGRLLFQVDRLPLPHEGTKNPLPVKLLAYRMVPKRLWPKGLIEECLSPQRELNRGLGNIAEIFRLYRSPKWFIDRAWNLAKDAITSAPDEVVEGDFRGAVPQPVMPGNLPAFINDYAEKQRNELRHVSNQYEVSDGQVPTGANTATSLAILRDAELQRQNSPALQGKIGLEDLAKHILTVQAERYREPRYHVTPGRGAEGAGQNTMVFGGQDIGPLDVVVEITSGVEDSDTARQEVINNWATIGLFAGGIPLEFALPILRDVGQSWLADILEQQAPAVQQRERLQQMAQAQLQPGQPDPAAEQQGQLALQQQQQGAEQQAQAAEAQQAQQTADQQAQEAAAQRAHEMGMAQLQAQQDAAHKVLDHSLKLKEIAATGAQKGKTK